MRLDEDDAGFDEAGGDERWPARLRVARSRLMYVERKVGSLDGSARIGRVFFSRSGSTLYYRGQRFRSLKGGGFKANSFDVATGEHYWISGPRRDQNDRLHGGNRGVVIDDDVRVEYRALLRR